MRTYLVLTRDTDEVLLKVTFVCEIVACIAPFAPSSPVWISYPSTASIAVPRQSLHRLIRALRPPIGLPGMYRTRLVSELG